MNTDDVKKYIKQKKQEYVCTVMYKDIQYFEAIDVKRNNFIVLFYKIADNKICLEKNKETLGELRKISLMEPSPICYNQYPTKKEEKIQSEELRIWVQTFAMNVLENCELFTKIYGEGFASEMLLNLEKLYIEVPAEKDRNWARLSNGYEHNCFD